MAYDYELKIDGVTMPTPAKNGIVEADQIIWSNNAGRSANGNFVGDVIAVKKTLTITWNPLTYAQFVQINSHISRIGTPFITVSYKDRSGQRVSFRGYTEGVQGTITTYTTSGKISNVTLNVIQQ